MKILRLLWEIISLSKSCGHIEAEIASDTDSRLVGFNANAFMRVIYE